MHREEESVDGLGGGRMEVTALGGGVGEKGGK